MRPTRRFRTSVLTLALLAAPVLAAPPEPVKGRCPYGHEHLVSVPVLYGYPDFNPELERALDQKEIIVGGCTPDENSPSHVTLCRRCGFRLRHTEKGDLWSRDSGDLKSFEIPLAPFIAEVVRVFDKGIGKAKRADSEDAPSFEQSLRRGVSVEESAGIIVGDSARRVLPQVERILAGHSIRVTPKKLQPTAVSFFDADLEDANHEGWIAITGSAEDRTVVAITWNRKARPGR